MILISVSGSGFSIDVEDRCERVWACSEAWCLVWYGDISGMHVKSVCGAAKIADGCIAGMAPCFAPTRQILPHAADHSPNRKLKLSPDVGTCMLDSLQHLLHDLFRVPDALAAVQGSHGDAKFKGCYVQGFPW